MIKVLQVIEDMGLNSGVSSMLLNYYKYMNHDKVNFDFITFKPVPEDVKEYCEKNDSIIYQVSELCGKNVINGTLKKEIEKIIKKLYETNITDEKKNLYYSKFKQFGITASVCFYMGLDVVYFTVIMQKVLTWQLKSSEIISLTTMVFFMQM